MQGANEPKSAWSDSPDPPAATGGVLVGAISRLGLPLVIFGSVLLAASVAIVTLMSPDRFPVRISEHIVRLKDLEQEQKDLMIQKADLLVRRQKIATTYQAPVMRQVEKLRSTVVPVGTILMAVEAARRSFRETGSDPISLPGIQADAQKRTISLQGEVRDPGGRSVQILAAFIDALRGTPGLTSVSEPEYKSQSLPGGLSVSPFSIILTLKPGA